jgi:phosphatidyl-myo-inositol dimannoside synthase
MRLIIVSSEFPPGPGGIGTHAYQLAKHLKGLGNDVLVLTSQSYVPLKDIADFNQKQDFFIFTLKKVAIALLEGTYHWNVIRKKVRKFNPDVVIASGWRSVALTATVLVNSLIPWVAIGHGSEFGDLGFLRNHVTKWAYSRANEIICVSHFTKGMMQSAGVKPKSTSVIHNGADDSKFHLSDGNQIIQIQKTFEVTGKFIALTVGNVTPRKGQEVVIRALPIIVREIPQIIYLMVGLPTYQKEFTILANQLGVQDHIMFLGSVDTKALVQLYQSCDLFLMTSQHTLEGDVEGFGIAVIEAALCGKPSIVTGGSGLEEAVVDGVTGVVISATDTNAIARAVIKFWKEPSLLRKMGNSAYERAIKNYSWKKTVLSYSQKIRSIDP